MEAKLKCAAVDHNTAPTLTPQQIKQTVSSAPAAASATETDESRYSRDETDVMNAFIRIGHPGAGKDPDTRNKHSLFLYSTELAGVLELPSRHLWVIRCCNVYSAVQTQHLQR